MPSVLLLRVFIQQPPSNVIFDRLHCYEVTLVNNCKTLLQKSETKIFKQKRLTEKLVRSKQEKKVTRFEMKSDNV